MQIFVGWFMEHFAVSISHTQQIINHPSIYPVQRIVTEWRMVASQPPKAAAKLRLWIANKPWPRMMLHWQFLIILRTRERTSIDTQSGFIVTRPREWWFAFNGAFQLNFSNANFFLAYLLVAVVSPAENCSPDLQLLFAANILCTHRPVHWTVKLSYFAYSAVSLWNEKSTIIVSFVQAMQLFTFHFHPQHQHHLHSNTGRLNWFRNLCADRKMKCHSWKTMDEIIDFASEELKVDFKIN